MDLPTEGLKAVFDVDNWKVYDPPQVPKDTSGATVWNRMDTAAGEVVASQNSGVSNCPRKYEYWEHKTHASGNKKGKQTCRLCTE